MVEVGLHLIEGVAELTFIFFLGISLLAALGLRFSYYAQQNFNQSEIAVQAEIWDFLRYIGVFAAGYAALWLVEILTSVRVPGKNGLWLAMTLTLVLSIRQISVTARGPSERLASFEGPLRLGFVAAIVLYVVLAFAMDESGVPAALESLTGAAFLAYGLFYFRRQIASTRLQGTMLDSLLRHLLPVLTFAALVNIVAIAIAVGVNIVIVLHVQLVFLIMTATALMTATIKLRQNLASL